LLKCHLEATRIAFSYAVSEWIQVSIHVSIICYPVQEAAVLLEWITHIRSDLNSHFVL
jgi:hypothetical protein